MTPENDLNPDEVKILGFATEQYLAKSVSYPVGLTRRFHVQDFWRFSLEWVPRHDDLTPFRKNRLPYDPQFRSGDPLPGSFEGALSLRAQFTRDAQAEGTDTIVALAHRDRMRDIFLGYADPGHIERVYADQTEFLKELDESLASPRLDEKKKSSAMYHNYFNAVAFRFRHVEQLVPDVLFAHVVQTPALLALPEYRFVAAVRDAAYESCSKPEVTDKETFYAVVAKAMDEKGFDITPGQAQKMFTMAGIFTYQESSSILQRVGAPAQKAPYDPNRGALIAHPDRVVVPDRLDEVYREEVGPANTLEHSSLHGSPRAPSPRTGTPRAPRKDFG